MNNKKLKDGPCAEGGGGGPQNYDNSTIAS